MHGLGLLATITVGITAALVLGFITCRLGFSPIIGYLLAGVMLGPHTPGIVADTTIASELAEIGVILLMFGVGMHFNWKDLAAVKSIAIPGAIGQSLVATVVGAVAAKFFGWGLGSGIVLGLAVSVASTVVLMRVLTDHHLLDTAHGHIAVGWLIVEDVFTVIALVMLPVLNGTSQEAQSIIGIASHLLYALAKLAVLAVLMAVVGKRVIPYLMEMVARTGLRELFTLTVLTVALGIAVGSSWLFGSSIALGAFLAGIAVSQSKLSQKAAEDAIPMRDAFAVLFFVSVGMLFDPRFLIEHPGLLIAVLAIVMFVKPLTALAIVLLFRYPIRTALVVAIGLAQIGEFSFILSELARSLGLFPEAGHNALVAAALLSIGVNPILFGLIKPIESIAEKFSRSQPV